MKLLCVIPARRGSKRLPLKNILPLAGIPMIAHTINAAINSDVFNEVIVSTEDQEIADISKKFGADCYIRSNELAGDLVSATDVCLDVSKNLDPDKKKYDSIVCLQPSSPLRSSKDIKLSVEHFYKTQANYLVSVTPIDPHYFHWAVYENENKWKMYFNNKYMMERPLLPPVFRPNGAIKMGRINALEETHNFFGEGLETYLMPEERSIHVAEQFDYELAEFLLSKEEIKL